MCSRASLRITTKQKPVVEMQNVKRKEFKAYCYRKSPNTNEGEQEKEKRNTELENNQNTVNKITNGKGCLGGLVHYDFGSVHNLRVMNSSPAWGSRNSPSPTAPPSSLKKTKQDKEKPK